MYYFGARWYEEEIGRFVTPDIIPALNLYTYCENNPINLIDYFGLKPGDPYSTEDEAAEDALTDINSTSISEDKEYAGWVYQNIDKTYSYTNPNAGNKHSSLPGKKPRNKKVTGIYHTHGAESEGYDNENFSSQDKKVAKDNNVDMYLATPKGDYKKYLPKSGREIKNFRSKKNKGKTGR